MIGLGEIIIIFILIINFGILIWSFVYVNKKAAEIKRLNPYALDTWKVVVIHIFIIIIGSSIGGYLFPLILKFFANPISCLILPIYLKIKYKNVYPKK